MRYVLLLTLALSSCTRGLTRDETQFAAEIFGDAFDSAPVRFLEVDAIGRVSRTYPVRPQTACRERIAGPPDGPTFQSRTVGVVAWTHVLTNPDWTLSNYLDAYPEEIDLVSAMFFVHEMVHVWQWQNREMTGYSPFKAAQEHVPNVDPYLFETDDSVGFLDMGYEQQAALVEEYVCCRTIDPRGERTHRLWERLAAVMDVSPPTETPISSRVYGIDPEADLEGVCD